jgi:hypothetical protein
MKTDQRLEQIKRAHASARPNVINNPAFFHTHNDLGYVLGLLPDHVCHFNTSTYLCSCGKRYVSPQDRVAGTRRVGRVA